MFGKQKENLELEPLILKLLTSFSFIGFILTTVIGSIAGAVAFVPAIAAAVGASLGGGWMGGVAGAVAGIGINFIPFTNKKIERDVDGDPRMLDILRPSYARDRHSLSSVMEDVGATGGMIVGAFGIAAAGVVVIGGLKLHDTIQRMKGDRPKPSGPE